MAGPSNRKPRGRNGGETQGEEEWGRLGRLGTYREVNKKDKSIKKIRASAYIIFDLCFYEITNKNSPNPLGYLFSTYLIFAYLIYDLSFLFTSR